MGEEEGEEKKSTRVKTTTALNGDSGLCVTVLVYPANQHINARIFIVSSFPASQGLLVLVDITLGGKIYAL